MKTLREYIDLVDGKISESIDVGGISHSIVPHPGGRYQVVVKHGDKVAHTSLHNSEEEAKKALASQVAHSKKMLKVDEGDVLPFKRPESKIKPEVRRVFIRHLLDQGYTNDEISRMNDEQFTKAYYGIKGKTKVKDVRPNWTDDLPDDLEEAEDPIQKIEELFRDKR